MFCYTDTRLQSSVVPLLFYQFASLLSCLLSEFRMAIFDVRGITSVG